jgi:multidrug efflux pump subunit AcrB
VQLERAGGVGEVNVVGGLERAINVWVDAERLAAYRIPITQCEKPCGDKTRTCRAATSRPDAAR